MPNITINEKEFEIIKELSNNTLPDQRALSAKTGFSLGLINLIIKRLIKKGYIKAKQLNQRKIQYILTPKGFTEKATKSYHYTLKTIEKFNLIRNKIENLIKTENSNGISKFIICGNGEISAIVELIINNNKLSYSRIGDISELIDNSGNICLLVTDNRQVTSLDVKRIINVLETISID